MPVTFGSDIPLLPWQRKFAIFNRKSANFQQKIGHNSAGAGNTPQILAPTRGFSIIRWSRNFWFYHSMYGFRCRRIQLCESHLARTYACCHGMHIPEVMDSSTLNFNDNFKFSRFFLRGGDPRPPSGVC